VNVIGLIKTSRTAASMEPPGCVMELYRRHFGEVLLPCSVEGEEPVDAVASRSKDDRAVAVGLVNSSASKAARIVLKFTGAGGGGAGAPAKGAARIFRIDGPGVEAINVPGKPEAVGLRELPAADWTGSLPIEVPAHSVTLVRIEGAGK